jgi:tocopherol O-methyltransferase
MRHMTDDVRAYYEHNTRWFSRFGGGDQTHSVHRAVWGPGVCTQTDALVFAHRAVESQVNQTAAGRVVDLGCGIGGATGWLSERCIDAQVIGLTLSPTQAALARRHAPHASILEADFHDLPLPGALADLCFSIEAMAHSHDVPRFFAEAYRVTRPGGRLILIDDVAVDVSAARLFHDAFRAGWRTPGFVNRERLVGHAAAAGWSLSQHDDWTGWLRLRALPAPLGRGLLQCLMLLASRSAVLSASMGSIALQQLYSVGAAQYGLWVFTR